MTHSGCCSACFSDAQLSYGSAAGSGRLTRVWWVSIHCASVLKLKLFIFGWWNLKGGLPSPFDMTLGNLHSFLRIWCIKMFHSTFPVPKLRSAVSPGKARFFSWDIVFQGNSWTARSAHCSCLQAGPLQFCSTWVENFQTPCAARQGYSRAWPAAPHPHLPLLFASGFMCKRSGNGWWPCIQHTPTSFFCEFSLSLTFLVRNCQEPEILPHLHVNRVTCHTFTGAGRRPLGPWQGTSLPLATRRTCFIFASTPLACRVPWGGCGGGSGSGWGRRAVSKPVPLLPCGETLFSKVADIILSSWSGKKKSALFPGGRNSLYPPRLVKYS